MPSKNCTLVKALVVTLLLALAVLWWGGLAGAEAKKAHKDGKDQGMDFYGRPIYRWDCQSVPSSLQVVFF